jgi:hypothetical protein
MEAKPADDGRKLLAMANQTRRFSARTIFRGSYSQTLTVRTLLIVGLAALCGVSLLVAHPVFRNTGENKAQIYDQHTPILTPSGKILVHSC